jgi:rfaE bifunctional protein kinase chain/domain
MKFADSKDKRLVLVFGIFNVVHPGHIRLLNFARDLGAHLMVGVLSDDLAASSSHVNELDRLSSVSAIGVVDEAFLVTSSISDEIRRRRPSFVVKGKEYEGRRNLEEEVVEEYGGQLVFSSGESFLTSTQLLIKELDDPLLGISPLPREYLKRHSLDPTSLRQTVEKFSKMSVLVLGDLIVDEYIECEPLGMSQEEVSLVVSPTSTSRYVGGAGVVAAHAAALGATATVLSVVGDDQMGVFAREELGCANVRTHLINDPTRPTTVKQRFRSGGRSLLRVSKVSQRQISQQIEGKLIEMIRSSSHDLNSLIISDFNYGVVTNEIARFVGEFGRERSVVVSADSQSSSQVGDISRFKKVDVLTPTEREARLALRNSSDGLVVISELLSDATESSHVLLKLGSEGLLVNTRSAGSDGWHTDQLQALSSRPRDVAGAGDCLLVTATLALSVGASIWEAALLGSLAAAIQVSRVGNIPVTAGELIALIDR